MPLANPSPLPPKAHCVVIGAGLSGLSAAYTLAVQQGQQDILLLEASGKVGGCIQSEQVTLPNGHNYLLEAGPNSFPSKGSDALLALLSAVGLTPQATTAQQKLRYIALGQRMVCVPTSPWQAITTPLLSWPAKFRLATEVFRPPLAPRQAGEPDHSVKAWATYRLGVEAHDHLLEPFLSGVYAGDTAQLSMAAIFPKLVAAEQRAGSVLKGMLTAPKKPAPATHPNDKAAKKAPLTLYNLPQGLHQLPQALAKALPAGVLHLSTQVTALQPLGDEQGYHLSVTLPNGEVQSVQAKHVVIATPAPVAAKLLVDVSVTLADTLASVAYAPIAVVYTAYPKTEFSALKQGFGVLNARHTSPQTPWLGSIYSSQLFPERAPTSHILTAHFIGGAHHPTAATLPDEALEALAQETLGWQMGLAASAEAELVKIYRWPEATPQYDLQHTAKLATLAQTLPQHPGLTLAGNYLQGINLNHCVLAGQQAVAGV
jgi:oxygen-dependent protoporphyrinogen oxidase